MTPERQEHKEILDAIQELKLDVREIFTKIENIERYSTHTHKEIDELEKRMLNLENKTAPIIWFFGASGVGLVAGVLHFFI